MTDPSGHCPVYVAPGPVCGSQAWGLFGTAVIIMDTKVGSCRCSSELPDISLQSLVIFVLGDFG